ncbi:hypothetical protein [Pendulispora albinea]|uniref:Uncharacterized protein n=1 Tax=Pendulispora albinea TaxID=2741071 RepID=A0ABZ2LMX6_9BACT
MDVTLGVLDGASAAARDVVDVLRFVDVLEREDGVRATRAVDAADAAVRAGAGRAIGISRQTARRRGIFHEMLRV